jgi:hypothetical protein
MENLCTNQNKTVIIEKFLKFLMFQVRLIEKFKKVSSWKKDLD